MDLWFQILSIQHYLCKHVRLSQWFSGKDSTCSAGDRGVKSLHRVWLFATPWTVAYQAPLSMGFSRQQYWSGLPFPSLGDLLDTGIELGSPTFQAEALLSEPPRKPRRQQETCVCPGRGHGNPLQYSCWECPMDRGAWWATVHEGQRSLVGYSPWGSDMTETAGHTHTHTHTHTSKRVHNWHSHFLP